MWCLFHHLDQQILKATSPVNIKRTISAVFLDSMSSRSKVRILGYNALSLSSSLIHRHTELLKDLQSLVSNS